MKILGCLLVSMAALFSSVLQAEEHQSVCAKAPMFSITRGYIHPSIAGTYVQGSGFINQFVTVKFAHSALSEETEVNGLGCSCLCSILTVPPDYYYGADPIDAANLMTSSQFFDFVSSREHNAGVQLPSFGIWSFEQPRVIKLTPPSGSSFSAVVAKMVRRVGNTNFSFYAGYEVSNPPVEGSPFVPCATKTQIDNIVNWSIPGLAQVQLDQADALSSVAFIRLARNTSANRSIPDCTAQ